MARKEKIEYYDDGRTIADMSNVGRKTLWSSSSRPAPRFRDVWHTYWDATKMMLLPTLVAAGGLGLIFGILYLLFSISG